MSKKYDLAVVIGRFQPFHYGHKKMIDQALEIADQVLVLIGSVNKPISHKNPIQPEERELVIRSEYSEEERLSVSWLQDCDYADESWQAAVMAEVDEYACLAKNVCIVGYEKDDSSYYLKTFNWEFEQVEPYLLEDGTTLDATYIRNEMYESVRYQTDGFWVNKDSDFIQRYLPERSLEALKNSINGNRESTVDEYKFVQNYRQQTQTGPYPVQFMTCDPVVVQSGHILLVRRGQQPGVGLWALPGGYLEEGESIQDGIIRELKEETNLRVPNKVLRGSMSSPQIFDAPNRDPRGRIVTFAGLIRLDDSQPLPEVRQGSDAAAAEWVPLSQLVPEEFYADHYWIINKMMQL